MARLAAWIGIWSISGMAWAAGAKVGDKVFFDIEIDGKPAGKLVMGLYNDVVPKTAKNFRYLSTGETLKDPKKKSTPLYKGSTFHRVISGFMMQGGDFTNHNGTGGRSIYGDKFPDENFKVKHDRRGLLSMANAGKNTNGSQFFITFGPTPHLNGKHVVFGEVLDIGDSMKVVAAVEKVGSGSGRTKKKVVIANSGLYTETKKAKKGSS